MSQAPGREAVRVQSSLSDGGSEFSPTPAAFQLGDPQPKVGSAPCRSFCSSTGESGSCLALSWEASCHDSPRSPQQAPRETLWVCTGWVCVCGCGEACVFSLTGHEFSPRLPRQHPSLWRWGPSLMSRAWEAPPKQLNSVQLLLGVISKQSNSS